MLDLVGCTLLNEHGVPFEVVGFFLDGPTGNIFVDVLDFDEDGKPVPAVVTHRVCRRRTA